MRIIISRTDSIGDVVLTLPMAGILKQSIPGCTIIFLGRDYTRPVIEACEYVDEFVSWTPPIPGTAPTPTLPQTGEGEPPPRPSSTQGEGEPPPRPSPKRGREYGDGLLYGLRADIIIHVFPVKEICRAAKMARIPVRIATAGRSFPWFTCNRLLHIPRKNSSLHEAQLNLKMLKPLGIDREFGLEEIAGLYGLKVDRGTSGQGDGRTYQLKIKNYELQGQPDDIRHSSFVTRHSSFVNRQSSIINRKSIILHPKSKGSAREWGLENFSKLICLLPAEKFDILVTGTADEGAMMQPFLQEHRDRITDMTGKLSLSEFMSLISRCDGLVAASTGPLHLAAALGIRAVGIYAPMRPIFPQRWAPIGKNAMYLVLDKTCSDCRKTMDCACIRSITPEDVAEKLLNP